MINIEKLTAAIKLYEKEIKSQISDIHIESESVYIINSFWGTLYRIDVSKNTLTASHPDPE